MNNKWGYCCNDDLPHIVKAGKNAYNAEVYVNNWYEETVRNTLRRKEFLQKRECGDLSIQRTQTMVDLLLKRVELTIPPTDDKLRYGHKIQLILLGPNCKVATDVYPFKRNYCELGHMALSATVPPESIDHAPYLSTDSIISVSPLLFPVVRNSFIIEHPECPTRVGEVVNYGDVFRLRAFDTQHFPLYLFSAPAARLHYPALHSAQPKVRFSDIPLQETLWCAHPLDEDEVFRMEIGIPVKMKTKLMIKHNMTGLNLSIEPMFHVITYFGCEYEATVDTKIDTRRNTSFENIWYFDCDRYSSLCEKEPCEKEFEKQAEFSAKINVNSATRSAAEEEKFEEEQRKAAEENMNNIVTPMFDEDEEEAPQGNPPPPESNDLGKQSGSKCSQPQPKGGLFALAQVPKTTEDTPSVESVKEEAEKLLKQWSIRGKDGYRFYDPRTAPQPHAYGYRVQDDQRYMTFPNMKWNCAGTDCCNPPSRRPPPPQPVGPQDCTNRGECCKPGPRPESLNVTATTGIEGRRLLQ